MCPCIILYVTEIIQQHPLGIQQIIDKYRPVDEGAYIKKSEFRAFKGLEF